MRNRVAASLAIASLVLVAACDANVVQQSARADARQAAAFDGRYQVDSSRGRVWWLTREGVFVHSARAPEKLSLSLPGWLWVGAPYSCLPDLALGPHGEAIVTSNVVSTLWKIDPETLAVTVHPLSLDSDADKDVGFSALVYSAEHEAFFAVSDTYGSLWKIDPKLQRAEKIALSVPLRDACRIAMGARVVPLDTGRTVGLCVRTPQKDMTVDLVLPHRSGYVRNAPCTDVTWRFRQLSLNHR
jgi:hypothetical protein